MSTRAEDLRKKYFGTQHLKQIKTGGLPKVSFFSSNLDAHISLNGANSDDDYRHYYRAGG